VYIFVTPPWPRIARGWYSGCSMPRTVFLLSPANCSGRRASLLLREASTLELSRLLRARQGAPLGDLFSFVSGLYFRGKVAYARAFADPPPGVPGALVITPHRGLLTCDHPTRLATLRAFTRNPVDPAEPRYAGPLRRDARRLGASAADCRFVLLGSVATPKYIELLDEALDGRLVFPEEFVGRGDMSRGALMLRCARAGVELSYVGAAVSGRHRPAPGFRPRPVDDVVLAGALHIGSKAGPS
jgi:hypothetical protein